MTSLDQLIGPEILTRLDAIASQIGVKIEILWPILVKQAYVKGVEQIIDGFLCALAAFFLARLLTKWKSPKEDYGFASADIGLFKTFGWVAVVILSFFSLNVTGGVSHLLNPDYYAILNLKEWLLPAAAA